MSSILGVKASKVPPLTVDSNFSDPRLALLMNAGQPGLIVRAQLPVLCVLTHGGQAKISYPVIRSVAIDMVYVAGREFAEDHQPNQPVFVISFAVDLAGSIPVSSY